MRIHGFKFQSVVSPDGMIVNLYGPVAGRRHDAHLLTATASGILNFMEANFNVDGRPLCTYGDAAYPQRGHLMRLYLGADTPNSSSSTNRCHQSARLLNGDSGT